MSSSSSSLHNKKGWLLVCLSFFIYFVCDGLTFSFGLIFVDILRHFKRSTSRTSVIASFINCLPLLYSPFVCILINKWKFRRCTMLAGLLIFLSFSSSFFIGNFVLLQIVYGFLLTFGFSIGYLTAYTVLPYWFDKNIAMATGITVSGSGIGQALISFLINYMLEYYGWQGTSLVLGGISLNIAVLGYLYTTPSRMPPSELRTSVALRRKSRQNIPFYTRFQYVISLYQLWLFFAVNFFVMLAFSTPYVFLADYIRSHDIHLNTAVPYALMGIMTTISQFSLGLAANKHCCPDWILYSMTMALAALSCVLPVIWPYSKIACLAHSISYAFFISPSYVLMITLLIECGKSENLDVTLALTQVFQGIASLIGLPICGLLKDKTGDYIWSYAFTSISLFVAALLILTWPLLKAKNKLLLSEDVEIIDS